MNKVLDFLKEHKYLMVALVLVGISITLGVTYSNYIVTSNDHKAAEMYIGELKYSIEIDGESVNNLSVPSGETIIDVKVNNQNPVDTYYKLLYLNNSNLKVKYFESAYDLDDSNNTTKSYDKSNDSVASSNSKTIKLQITNNSTSSQKLGLSVKGGYITNTLSDITVPSTYSEITSFATNTYFCKTTNTLTQGTKYVNGEYAYAYKQSGMYAFSGGIEWNNINDNGWGVQLTNKKSTTAVTSKLCTYINDDPVISMSYMFSSSKATAIDMNSFNTHKVIYMDNVFNGSQATTIDVSKFDTSNVTNMSNMFNSSQATIIDVSKFDTSNVTNMSNMFNSSQATTLDVSKFDTAKVTDMSYMFTYSQAATIDVSNFDTSNVTNMSSMFSSSQVTTLYLNNFNTSNVTDMRGMFYRFKGQTLDISSFDTSKVTDMASMFTNSQITTLDLSNFNTSNVTNMASMLSGIKITKLDLSSFDTRKVENMSWMFSNSNNLKTIYASDKFKTSNVTNYNNMFTGCTNLIGGSGTKYNSSYVGKSYAHIDGGTSNPGYFTEIANKPKEPESFATDSWKTIIKAVRNNNISKYHVGDTRTIDMGTYGTHTLRIANTSTPSECSASGFSQTACGFVLEFADIITEHNMNPAGEYKGTTYNDGWNVDGWPASSMYTFVNNDIYNAIPSEIKTAIIDTTVVSGHGSTSGEENFTSTDKLYLLAPGEVWTDWKTSSGAQYDTAIDLTRTLDYYTNEGVTTSNYSGAVKKSAIWWLRTAISIYDNGFYAVGGNGYYHVDGATITFGVAPAFRLG